LKIPPFGALYKKIKIAQNRLHLTWKREKEEEMRFQKRQVYNKKTTPKFLPIIPLLSAGRTKWQTCGEATSLHDLKMLKEDLWRTVLLTA
jgi:hypothetical protein